MRWIVFLRTKEVLIGRREQDQYKRAAKTLRKCQKTSPQLKFGMMPLDAWETLLKNKQAKYLGT